MSLRATLWALDEAPVTDARHVLVLVALADHADDNGRGCWPSVTTIAARARCSVRTVHRALRELEAAGVIVRGDQSLVAKFRKDKRPVVYDLSLSARGASLAGRSVSGVSSVTERGDKPGRSGVSPVSHKPSLNRSINRGAATCITHLLALPCRGCAADRLVQEDSA